MTLFSFSLSLSFTMLLPSLSLSFCLLLFSISPSHSLFSVYHFLTLTFTFSFNYSYSLFLSHYVIFLSLSLSHLSCCFLLFFSLFLSLSFTFSFLFSFYFENFHCFCNFLLSFSFFSVSLSLSISHIITLTLFLSLIILLSSLTLPFFRFSFHTFKNFIYLFFRFCFFVYWKKYQGSVWFKFIINKKSFNFHFKVGVVRSLLKADDILFFVLLEKVNLEKRKGVFLIDKGLLSSSDLVNLIQEMGFDASFYDEINTNNVLIHIEGMTCNSCVKNIETTIGKVKGINSVNVIGKQFYYLLNWGCCFS